MQRTVFARLKDKYIGRLDNSKVGSLTTYRVPWKIEPQTLCKSLEALDVDQLEQTQYCLTSLSLVQFLLMISTHVILLGYSVRL